MPPKKKPRTLLSITADEFTSLRAKIPFVSQSALAKVLALANTEELPNIWTRKSLRHFARTTTPYGPLHFQKEIDKHKIEFQNPFATFWYLCTHSPAFRQLVSDSLTVHSSSVENKWGMIFYSD